MMTIENITWEWAVALRTVTDRLSCPVVPAEMARLATAMVAALEHGIGGPHPDDVRLAEEVCFVGRLLAQDDTIIDDAWQWALAPVLGRGWFEEAVTVERS
jgi:hypothetical protein